MNPIYVPSGKAKEYGDYAVNIYTGCPHRCNYCFAPNVRRMDREKFHSCVEPRKNIVEETRKQLERDETLRGKLIHLCFTCDPYPTGYDTTPTREIIKLLKEYGNHVQILTKGDGTRDFDLLDENDWCGITLSGGAHIAEKCEPNAKQVGARLDYIIKAKKNGIKTWISFEPVICERDVFDYIFFFHDMIDKVKIGKLNYHPSNIEWKQFGEQAEALCKRLDLDYYIKDSLRAEMEKGET